MSVWALLIAGSVGIHVGSAEGVTIDESSDIALAIASQIESHTDDRVDVDTSDWDRCTDGGSCLAAVRARLRTDDLLVLRIIAAPVQVLVTATRYVPGRAPHEFNAKVDRTVMINATTWAALVDELYEAAPKAALVGTATTGPKTANRGTALPGWVAVGAGGAAAVVGTVFGMSGRSALHEIESNVQTPASRTALDDRARTHATAANVLFGVAATSLVTGIVLILID